MRAHRVISSPPPARPLSMSERLRTAHLRPTATRTSILQVVEALPRPVTVGTVFKEMLDRGTAVSMGTVYRVLGDFASAGLLVREWVPGIAVPKAAYSLLESGAVNGLAPTHRFVCRRCGHSTAFRDVELLEELRRFVGRRPAQDNGHYSPSSSTTARTAPVPNRSEVAAQKNRRINWEPPTRRFAIMDAYEFQAQLGSLTDLQ